MNERSEPNWSAVTDALNVGDVVILPTETVFGIAARADMADAISKIYALKGRDFDKPLAVCVRDMAQAQTLAIFDANARALAKQFWPGPLTLVLNAKNNIAIDPRALGEIDGIRTIALRCPDANWASSLKQPLALTSANKSGEPDAVRYVDAVSSFDGQITMGLRTDAALSGAPSTIVRLADGNITILRQGELRLTEAGT